MQSVHWNELFNSLSDYMTVFVVNSIKALRDDGELVFITPSFWFHTQHAQQLRDFLLRNGHFTEIITFGESQVFENVSSSILIFRFVKSKMSATKIDHYRFIGGRKVPSNLDLKNKAQFTLESIPHFQSGRHWTLSSEERQVVLQKFEEWTENKFNKDSELFRSRLYPTLGEYVDIANGMVSGLDRAFRVTPELQQQLNTAELRAIRPVTKGADLARLAKIGTSLYIDIPPGLSEMQVKKTFPNLFQHLSQFRETLEKRYSYGRKLPFWEWAFRRSESFFLNPKTKVFVPCKERLTNKSHVRFSLITDGSVATQDVTAIAPRTSTREAIEYIVAFLTLDEVTAWIREKGLMKGGVAEFSERPLTSIPFRPIDWTSTVEQEAHSQIVTTVKQSNIFNQTEKLQIIREIFELSLGLSTA